MRALIISDDDAVAQRIHAVMARKSEWALAGSTVHVDAGVWSSSLLRPDLQLIVIPSDEARAIQVLQMLHQASAAPVVAIGPATDPHRILKTLHEGGAQQYVDEALLETQLETELDLRSRSPATTKGPADRAHGMGKVLAVHSPSGGSGSSVLAVNLAGSLAAKHHRSALVDLNTTVGDLAVLLNLQPTYSIADLCQNLHRFDMQLFEKILVPHESGIHLLASPRSFREIDTVTAEGVRQALLVCRMQFPYVVVDIDHTFCPVAMEAFHLADTILVTFRLDFASLRNVRRTLERLEASEISRSRIKLVASRYGQPRELPISAVEKALGRQPDFYVPDDPKTVNRSINTGIPVITGNPWSAISRRFTTIAAALNGAVPAGKAKSGGFWSH